MGAYLEALSTEGFSPYTTAYRQKLLRHFAQFLEGIDVDAPTLVTRDHLEHFKRSLGEHRKADGMPLSRATQATYVTALRSLFQWLTSVGLIPSDPSIGLRPPLQDHRLPRAVLSVPQVEAVLAIPDVTTTLGLRDRAILEVLYSTGIRRSELCALRINDIDADRQLVTVNSGKGRRDRVVPIGKRAVRWTQQYLLNARPHLFRPPEHSILFLTRQGNDLTPDHLTQRVGTYVRIATGRKGACHAFRHSAATLLLDGGADIRHVQEILGHVELSTTQIYTHVSIGRLVAVHARCHPAGDEHYHERTEYPGNRSAS